MLAAGKVTDSCANCSYLVKLSYRVLRVSAVPGCFPHCTGNLGKCLNDLDERSDLPSWNMVLFLALA